MDDRIRLAKAMGWKSAPCDLEGIRLWHHPQGGTFTTAELPDPFTDANDDYACLQFAREQHFVAYMEYYLCMISESRADYKVGDYARALLGALDNEDG